MTDLQQRRGCLTMSHLGVSVQMTSDEKSLSHHLSLPRESSAPRHGLFSCRGADCSCLGEQSAPLDAATITYITWYGVAKYVMTLILRGSRHLRSYQL